MTPPALSPTADSFANLRTPAWDNQIVQKSWTIVTTLGISDEVSETLDSWGSTLVAHQQTEVAFPKTEVEAINYMMTVLDLPLNVVLKAVDVPKRTFHGWKSKGHRPRQGAKDRIWAMAVAVSGLVDGDKDVAAWFHANPAVMKAFKSGDTRKLALADIAWVKDNSEVVQAPVLDHDTQVEESLAAPLGTSAAPRQLRQVPSARSSDLS